jgi:hypothetical protein
VKIEVFLKSNGADAKGIYDTDSNEITLKKGGVLVINLEATCPDSIRQNYRTAREQLNSGAIQRRKDGKLILARNIPKLSPSAAYVIATGKAGSGPDNWKSVDGRQSIKEIRNGVNAPPPRGPDLPDEKPDQGDAESRVLILREVANRIQDQSWQRHFRGNPVGDQVHGWTGRLKNYALVGQEAPSLIQHLQWLKSLERQAVSYDPGGDEQNDIGLELGAEILHWGGVTRGNLERLPDVIDSVCSSARDGARIGNAPMNSGWTKIQGLRMS